MSYTVPGGQPQGKSGFVTSKIREAMVAELTAINEYASHIANSKMEKVNRVWRMIMLDEKKHYGMFLTLLRKYDPMQYEAYLYYQNHPMKGDGPIQPYTPDYNDQMILNLVRNDIKGELEAAILYDDYASKIPYADVKQVFQVISRDEKYHVEHLTQLLLHYDPDPYNGLKE
ncbi:MULTISPECIES: ferritin family protein [Pontibacillus]|uniref:Ferritin family protein n=1 Tax=Pontibacillus chungwhensis TaxID=265426 RepID=A0ABY8UZ12_9BACI|nr:MULTISPECIES: ferritin family protein [Pontibacillus]MCD5325972.1 ferritin-like domain-containing protein [Pontibacillus sp. HN14]WIF98428.1 ferritin family protein [Pontibacillus chungwhensis]